MASEPELLRVLTYDLLVSNIGGTYDLADQLPSNQEFGHFLVVSQSQVPRKFCVNLAIVYLCGAPLKKRKKTWLKSFT